MGGRAGALVRATHPAPATFVTLLTGAVVAALGGSGAEVLLSLLSTALGQVSVGWSNDYLDRDRDSVAQRADKPLPRGTLSPALVMRAAIAAWIASPLLALPLGIRAAAVITAAIASAWVYNLRLKDTLFSWVPYVVSFGLLPVFAWLVARDSLPPAWIVLSAGGLGIAGHLMNTIPDLETDRKNGLSGLPHRLGHRGSLLLATAILATLLGVFTARTHAFRAPSGAQVAAVSLAAALVIAAAIAAGSRRPRAGWYLTMAGVGAIVLVLLVGLSRAGLGA